MVWLPFPEDDDPDDEPVEVRRLRTGAGAGAADCVAVLAELLVERAARLTGGA
jgi:hypothetical protein